MALSYKLEIEPDKYNDRKVFVFSSECSVPLNNDVKEKITEALEKNKSILSDTQKQQLSNIDKQIKVL